jgi:hypothetical protein
MKKSKGRKIKSKNKIFILSALVILPLSLGIFYFSGNKKVEPAKIVEVSQEDSKIIYPHQYSDENITENAIKEDSKFKNLVIFNKEEVLANAIDALPNGGPEEITKEEKGTWLWTPIEDITPKYMADIINGAKKNGLNSIYLSIDSYLDIYIMADGKEKTDKKKSFDNTIENFITLANKNGIEVDAETGWRNWAEPGHLYKPFAVVDYAMKFNKTHDGKFRSLQYDIEPYLLDNYKKDKKTVLKNFVTLVNETVKRLGPSDLSFAVVVPDFYDGTNKETPVFSYAGESGYAIDHLLRVLDKRVGSRIIVMSYRNFSLGNDGSVEISKDEIVKGNGRKTKIIIAEETGDVKPPYVTFYDTSKSYYKKQLALVEKAFAEDKSFGGVATHYVNSLFLLK